MDERTERLCDEASEAVRATRRAFTALIGQDGVDEDSLHEAVIALGGVEDHLTMALYHYDPAG